MSNYESQGGRLKVGKGNAKKIIKALAGSKEATEMAKYKKWSQWLWVQFNKSGSTAGQKSLFLQKIKSGEYAGFGWIYSNDKDDIVDTFNWLVKNNVIRVKTSPLRGKTVYRMVKPPARIFKLAKPNNKYNERGYWKKDFGDFVIEISNTGVVRYWIYEGNHAVDRIRQNPMWNQFMSAVKLVVPGKRFKTGYWSEYNGEYMDEDEYEWKKDEHYDYWAL